MSKESHEQFKSRLDDKEFFLQIKKAVADRLDELATDPALDGGGFPLNLGEKIRKDEKVSGSIMIRDAIIGVGEDFRLTRDEINFLKNRFLDNENT